jgi:hypothetical protein
MPQIMSNEDVKQMEIYGGVAAGAGLIGLAYGVDATSPLYKQDARNAKLAKRAQKESAKAKERVERGTRSASSDARVRNVGDAHRMGNSVNNVLNQREARRNEVETHRQNGTGYDPLNVLENANIQDGVELNSDGHIYPTSSSVHAPIEEVFHTPMSPSKKAAHNAYKKIVQTASKIL